MSELTLDDVLADIRTKEQARTGQEVPPPETEPPGEAEEAARKLVTIGLGLAHVPYAARHHADKAEKELAELDAEALDGPAEELYAAERRTIVEGIAALRDFASGWDAARPVFAARPVVREASIERL